MKIKVNHCATLFDLQSSLSLLNSNHLSAVVARVRHSSERHTFGLGSDYSLTLLKDLGSCIGSSTDCSLNRWVVGCNHLERSQNLSDHDPRLSL